MATTQTGGTRNLTSEVTMADDASVTLHSTPGRKTTIHSIAATVVCTGTGQQCVGAFDLNDGGTSKWFGRVEFTSTAANQGKTVVFPLDLELTPTTSVAVRFDQVVNASTGAVAVVWS